MKLIILIICFFPLPSLAQDSIGLPESLKFGMSLQQFQNRLQKKAYSYGTSSGLEINQYENFQSIYHLRGFSYQNCPLLGTFKPGIFTGLFTGNKLSVIRISFTGKVNYYEVKEALVSKYGLPQKEDIENLQDGGACKVALWDKDGILIRLYKNASEPIIAPYLEYIHLSLLDEAKNKKLQINKAALK
jgi:hypothetical protein